MHAVAAHAAPPPPSPPHHCPRSIDVLMAERMLAYVDGWDSRDTWLAVGMSLKDEFGDAAFAAWDRWSAKWERYQPKDVLTAWKSIKAGRGYSVGTLIHLAMQGGFKFEQADQARVVTPGELEAKRAEREARLAEVAAIRERDVMDAADRACDTWLKSADVGVSPYLVRKGIDRAEGARHSRDWLVVPMMRYDMPLPNQLRGVQIIKPSGEKRFTAGMAKTEPCPAAPDQAIRGVCCALGELPADSHFKGLLMVAEGYATAATVRMATARKVPVVAAFDCHGLAPAARVLLALYPAAKLAFLADDDYLTDGNPGIKAAKACAGAFKGAQWIAPVWPHGVRRDGGTDFNDLHLSAGLAVVTRQIEPMLSYIISGRV